MVSVIVQFFVTFFATLAAIAVFHDYEDWQDERKRKNYNKNINKR